MSLNTERLKDKARKYEHRRQFEKAIEIYSRIVNSLEGKTELIDDLALFNKLGDLYLKVGDVGSAVESYERAADHYSDQGLANNAIALCNKILRNAPGRTAVYLKLAKLLMQRGFTAEVKRNLLEYWDRMVRAEEPVAAFEHLQDFVGLYSGRHEVYLIVAELFMRGGCTEEARALLAKLHEDMVRSSDEPEHRRMLEEIKAIDPTFRAEPEESDESESSGGPDIVFISPEDTDDLDISLASVELEISEPDESGLDIEVSRTAEMPRIMVPDEDVHPTPDASIVAASGEVRDVDDASSSAESHAEEREEAEEVPEDVAAMWGGATAGRANDQDTSVSQLSDSGIVEHSEEEAAMQVDEPAVSDEAPAPPAVPPHIAQLESKVAESPDVLEIHRELAEALLEYGDRERGLQELDIVLLGCEELEQWFKAQAIAEEILRIDPNSVRHHRRRIGYVERNGAALEPGSFERGRWVNELVRANLELGDALVRQGIMDEAQAVYRRVLRFDSQNARAETALETLGFSAERDSNRVPSDTPAPVGGNYRMRVTEPSPTGEQDEDLQDVLKVFRSGIDSHVSDEDSQAHYDLGIAFKEMGLVDEAISEFQKALGGEQGRRHAAEALGLCFFEKGQFSVAATILKRAADTDSLDDSRKVGLLYWLGRCHQEQGETQSARGLFQRVLAVDAEFHDVGERVQTLRASGE